MGLSQFYLVKLYADACPTNSLDIHSYTREDLDMLYKMVVNFILYIQY